MVNYQFNVHGLSYVWTVINERYFNECSVAVLKVNEP